MNNNHRSFISSLKEKSFEEIRNLITHLKRRYGDDILIPKRRAFWQVTAKTLYALGDKFHNFSSIREGVEGLLGVEGITPNRITSARTVRRLS